jgi:hypothetical protein
MASQIVFYIQLSHPDTATVKEASSSLGHWPAN